MARFFFLLLNIKQNMNKAPCGYGALFVKREFFCLQLWLYEYLYKKLKSLLAVIDRTYSSRLSRCHCYLNFCPVIVTTYSVCLNCLLKNCRSVNILQE